MATRKDSRRARPRRALPRARVLLEKWGVPFTAHVALGDRADVISAYAKADRCHAIVLGTPRRSPLPQWIRDSVAARVVEMSSAPVEIIAGEVASPLERYGIPAGIGLAAVLITIAE